MSDVKGTSEISGTEDLLVHIEDRIATVTINRAAKHNAMNLEVFGAIGKVFTALDADPELRCVVIRGAGGKAFSAGADISEFESVRKDKAAAKKYAETSLPSSDAVVKCRHPVIALIEGLCVGGGFGLAALCDLRICGESSRFGVPVKRLEAAAFEWAAKVAEGAPLTARWHKQFVYRLMESAPLSEAEKDMGYDAFDTEDFQRGYKAFLAKEKPSFVGR